MLGISPDPVTKLKRWHDKEAFGFDLLSDEDHVVLEKYGAWAEKSMYGKKYFGVVRSHWVIGPDGKVLDERIKISPRDSVEQGTAIVLGKESS